MGDKKDDFTRIENLAEFTHDDDEDVDFKLGISKASESSESSESSPSEKESNFHQDEGGGEREEDGESDSPPFDIPQDTSDDHDESHNEFSFQRPEQQDQQEDEPPSFNQDQGEESSGLNFSSSHDDSSEEILGDNNESEEFPQFDSSLNQQDQNQDQDQDQAEFPEDSGFLGQTEEEDHTEQPEPKEQTFPSFLKTEKNLTFKLGSAETDFTDDSSQSSSQASFSSSSDENSYINSSTEDLKEVSDFAENTTIGRPEGGVHPPYSLILKGIQYKDEQEEIVRVLREYKILNETNESHMKNSLEQGALLVSQISEYVAVLIVHKLRRFDFEIMMGPSDEIHPPKTFTNSRGLVDKFSLKQNKSISVNLENMPLEAEDILIALTPTLEGHQITKYLGVVASHRLLDESDLNPPQNPQGPQNKDKQGSANSDDEFQQYLPTLGQIYENLANELRQEAMKLQGNAVVGIAYQLTPIIPNKESFYRTQFKLTCTGNVVWVI